eukprot:EG_transcript_12128
MELLCEEGRQRSWKNRTALLIFAGVGVSFVLATNHFLAQSGQRLQVDPWVQPRSLSPAVSSTFLPKLSHKAPASKDDFLHRGVSAITGHQRLATKDRSLPGHTISWQAAGLLSAAVISIMVVLSRLIALRKCSVQEKVYFSMLNIGGDASQSQGEMGGKPAVAPGRALRRPVWQPPPTPEKEDPVPPANRSNGMTMTYNFANLNGTDIGMSRIMNGAPDSDIKVLRPSAPRAVRPVESSRKIIDLQLDLPGAELTATTGIEDVSSPPPLTATHPAKVIEDIDAAVASAGTMFEPAKRADDRPELRRPSLVRPTQPQPLPTENQQPETLRKIIELDIDLPGAQPAPAAPAAAQGDDTPAPSRTPPVEPPKRTDDPPVLRRPSFFQSTPPQSPAQQQPASAPQPGTPPPDPRAESKVKGIKAILLEEKAKALAELQARGGRPAPLPPTPAPAVPPLAAAAPLS